MALDRQISAGGHVVHFLIEPTCNGWNVREELDRTVVHTEHHDDWHRVERAVRLLELQVIRHGIAAAAAH